MKEFLTPERNQIMLMAHVALDTVAPVGSAVRFINDLVDELDTSEIEKEYAMMTVTGRKPIHPKTILKVALYAIHNCRFRLRKMEHDTEFNLAYRWLTGNTVIDHSTLGKFLIKFKEIKMNMNLSTSAVSVSNECDVETDMENVVNSHNEWDPLEEVIVGRIEDSVFPQRHIYVLGGAPKRLYDYLIFFGGLKRRPKKLFVEPAQKELNEFISILEAEGVKVRRPEVIDHSKKFNTPNWESKGYTSACPRDCFFTIGNEIIESPMSWRCRYFELHAYYSLLKEYFDEGAKWTSAPKPPLKDSLYNKNYTVPKEGQSIEYVINETEIVFDAADFVRCGTDIFVTRSNVTNQSGIEWLRRHLGDKYRIHIIETLSKQPMHIDTTFVPLGPGKVMINSKYVNRKNLPQILKTWDILEAPEPNIVSGGILNEHAAMCSMWLNMNVLQLDEERVIVEKSQESTIRALKKWGLKPISCNFLNFNPYGGAFHCATMDIRRRGKLQSYF